MALNVAINGFGRTGKNFLRAVLNDHRCLKKIAITAINIGPAAPDNSALFFKYDSLMSTFPGNVEYSKGNLIINEEIVIPIINTADPSTISWDAYHVDWVVDASGAFCNQDKARQHLAAGASHVIITAPMHDADVTIVPGINDDHFNRAAHRVISLASCTTNCFAHILKVIETFDTIQAGVMTTVHAYTNNQSLLDSQHKDPRRARAAAYNIIPTDTGADDVIGTLFPHLTGLIKARAVRVPVGTVSLLDFCWTGSQTLTPAEINHRVQTACTQLPFLAYTADPLVSSDYIEHPASAIVDGLLTDAVGSIGRIFAWYDNEYGYSSRIKDFILHNS